MSLGFARALRGASLAVPRGAHTSAVVDCDESEIPSLTDAEENGGVVASPEAGGHVSEERFVTARGLAQSDVLQVTRASDRRTARSVPRAVP